MSITPLSIQKSPSLIVQQTSRLQSSIFGNTTLIWPWAKPGILSVWWGPFNFVRCLKCSSCAKQRDIYCFWNPKWTGDYWKLPSIPTQLRSHSMSIIYCSTSIVCFALWGKKALENLQISLTSVDIGFWQWGLDMYSRERGSDKKNSSSPFSLNEKYQNFKWRLKGLERRQGQNDQHKERKKIKRKKSLSEGDQR